MKTDIVSIREVGKINEIRKSIAKIKGLSNCMNGQLVHFGSNAYGMVMGFNEEDVSVLLLGDTSKLRAGDKVYSEAESLTMPVGSKFLGRIVDALCRPLDGKGAIKEDSFWDVFKPAPSVLDRVPIEEMFVTGIRVIDSIICIGKGQRELVLGDRVTGKTTLCVDAILNQKDKDVICIYCCIGRDYDSFKRVVSVFKEAGVLDYMIVVAAIAASPIGEQYLAPYVAAALGEYFMYDGKDVFIAFDDLTKHAWAYRELSLLLERPPGREAYPGDIFYIHAQLMERAGKLASHMGSGSMTFFPVVDTLEGDFTGFIPTNIISMTDGQIYLNAALFSEGFKPAVDIGLSVSRIGNRVQSKLMRKFTKDLGLEYIQYRELLKATKLKSGFSEEVRQRLNHGEKVERIFIQNRNSPSSILEQMIFYYALRKKVLDDLDDQQCEDFKKNIFNFTRNHFPRILDLLLEDKEELTTKDEDLIKECLVRFFKEHFSSDSQDGGDK